MSDTITIPALSVAAFAAALADLPHETRAVVVAVEDGTPWATVRVSPLTDSARSVFPCYEGGATGDTERRTGHRGVMFGAGLTQDRAKALHTVIDRARRMAKAPA